MSVLKPQLFPVSATRRRSHCWIGLLCGLAFLPLTLAAPVTPTAKPATPRDSPPIETSAAQEPEVSHETTPPIQRREADPTPAKDSKPTKESKPPLAKSPKPQPIPQAGNSPASTPPAPAQPNFTVPPASSTADPEDPAVAENADADQAAVAKPVTPDPVQVFGWRENVRIHGVTEPLLAKLDSGALTSSLHAEEKELFERDGKKWVRFIVTDPRDKTPIRTRIEAPLVRIARIKEPGAESVPREVVRLAFQIGERKIRGEFTLNNRANMLAPVLIGRSIIKDLGWVDPGRTHLADQKIFR